MKRKRYSDEQIAFALRQAENGTLVDEICRKLGVSEATFYRWKKQFAGMGVVEIRRLKQLEEENAKLKRLVADLSLDKSMLQDVLRKSSEARRAPRCRRPSSDGLRHQRTAGLRRHRLRTVVAALPVEA
jgi:putative transposase